MDWTSQTHEQSKCALINVFSDGTYMFRLYLLSKWNACVPFLLRIRRINGLTTGKVYVPAVNSFILRIYFAHVSGASDLASDLRRCYAPSGPKTRPVMCSTPIRNLALFYYASVMCSAIPGTWYTIRWYTRYLPAPPRDLAHGL